MAKKKVQKKKASKKATTKVTRKTKAQVPKDAKPVKGEFYVPIKDAEYKRLTQERTENDMKVVKLKEERSELSKQINFLTKENVEISTNLDQKKIKKAVEAYEHKDFDTNTVRVWYDGDVIEERAMTDADRQESMDLDNAKAKKALEEEAKKKRKKKVTASKKTKSAKEEEIAEEIVNETRRSTKRSALDGGYSKDKQLGG